MDTNMYERQHGGDMEVGSYAHRPIIVDPNEIPSLEESALSPTELPFTQNDFDPQLQDALELMPELLGDEKVGVRYAINGLISMTPDGNPVLGETPEVKGLWSVAASWIKEGPGIARAVAEWMNGQAPEIDLHEADVARFYDHQRTRAHVTARAREGFNKMYGIVHPAEQWESLRPTRLSPVYGRASDLGAVFFETMGWERPYWYESNEHLVKKYGDRVMNREAEWESRWWSPIINAEHLAMRESCGLVDLSAFAVLDVTGPSALSVLQGLCVAQMDVVVGRVNYTSLLDERGGFKSDLTIMRLGKNWFRVVTGASTGMTEKKWFVDHLPADGSAQLTDLTSSWATFGLWGPMARDVLQRCTTDDVSHEGFPFATCRVIELGGIKVLASRISYIGELGWEIYVPIEEGAKAWVTLFEAGQVDSLVPVGIGVYATTGRLEKAYRALGNELTADYNIIEAGMARPTVKKVDFIGRSAYLAQRDQAPVAQLCTLTVDDHRATSGVARYMLGGEPIVSLEGERLVDERGRPSYVTSAGSGPSLGKHVLLSYLPSANAQVGTRLMVEYLGETYPVTVEVVGSTPLFDPDNARVRS
jgi:glycine cleavage system aminomethyltransferase T